MTTKIILFSALLFCMTAIAAQAAMYYVDKNSIGGTCSDTNNGTSTATPWCTLGKANGTAAPGDTVYVRSAIYNEILSLSTSGTLGNFITWQNYPGETPVIDGSGGAGLWTGLVRVYDRNYWKLIGFEIRNYDELLSVTGSSHHFEIRNNSIHNSGTSACIIVGGTSHDFILDGNDVYECHNTEGLEAIRVMEHTYNFMVSNNKVHDCWYIGIDIVSRTANGVPQKGVLKGNKIWNTGTQRSGHGIYIDGTSGIVVEENDLRNTLGMGISLQAEDNSCANSRNVIRKNRIYNSPYDITIGAWIGCNYCGTSNNNYVYNNTMYGPTSYYAVRITLGSSGNILKNNIFHDSEGKYFNNLGGANTWDRNLFYTGGTPVGTNYISNQNPNFVNPPSDFSLNPGSPAIDAGAWLTTITSASGSGTSFTVADAGYFHPPWGDYVPGDQIQLQGNSSSVVITGITGNTITVNQSVSWTKGNGVAPAYNGSAPDIGSQEYGTSYTRPAGPTRLRVVQWGLDNN